MPKFKKGAILLKRLVIVLLGIFVLTLSSVLPAEASGEGNKGTVNRGKYCEFLNIQWQITGTGASSGIRYRIVERQVTINDHIAAFQPLETDPGAGETLTQIFNATASNLAAKMGITPQQVEDWMNSGAVATMSATVEIHQDGKVLGTYTDYDSLVTAMKAKGFTQQSINNAKSLWGTADDPDKPEKRIDLEITDLKLLQNGKEVAIDVSYQVGSTLTVEAKFRSNSTKFGTTKLRAYQRTMGASTDVILGAPVEWNPTRYGDAKTEQWDITVKEGKNIITSSIGLKYENGWIEETFAGEREETYNNNKKTIEIMGTKEQPKPPTTGTPTPTPTPTSGNLRIYDAETIDKQKLKFKLDSAFNEAGDVKIRIQKYIKYTGDTQWSTSGSEDSFNTKMEANQTGKEMERDINMGNGTYKFEVSVNYNIKTKTGEKFKGIHEEITYADNITDTTDSQTMPEVDLPTVVGGNYRTGKLYYPVFKTKPDELHNITKVNREPIYGWKEYSVKDAKKPRQKIRLVE
jgi:hypothetical protein